MAQRELNLRVGTMSGPKYIFVAATFGLSLLADPSGAGHVHTTSVSDGTGSLSLNAAASQAPAQMLQGTSFENQIQRPAPPPPLAQATKVKGNGSDAVPMDELIGEPGDPFVNPLTLEIPRVRLPSDRDPASER